MRRLKKGNNKFTLREIRCKQLTLIIRPKVRFTTRLVRKLQFVILGFNKSGIIFHGQSN